MDERINALVPGRQVQVFVRKREAFPRPLTHDLLALLVEGLHAKVTRVVITELKDGTYYASLFLDRNQEVLSVDARPSDSIALALRTKAPIFVSQELFERSSQDYDPNAVQPDEPDDDDPFRGLLDDLDPPDKPDP